ncbi:tetratricopeptide repeat protein [Planctomycetota bacterium]|nr:tetratricopeptide repeat protein [Planctomycetota bacterium]
MALFGKKNKSEAEPKTFKRDLKKARRFFEHANTYADSRNYDGAIEMYVSGLKHDPDNMEVHEAIFDVAKRRKVGGGKPAGFKEKMMGGGSTPIEKMLHAEKLWAKDMLNCDHMADVMKHAVDATSEGDDLLMEDVAYWVGSQLIEFNTQQKKSDKLYRTAVDLFSEIGAYDKAVEACKWLVRNNDRNDKLRFELKQLEAQQYSMASDEGSSFRDTIRNEEGQAITEIENATTATKSQLDQLIDAKRAEVEEDPADVDRKLKLAEALLRKEEMDEENEAIDIFQSVFDETGQYRYKVKIGDIAIKQGNRKIRALRNQYADNPGDENLKTAFKQARKEQLVFELKEFGERVTNYPTDLGLKYELGRRQHQAGQIDEAIGTFQQAKQDPKRRSAAAFYLGDCYLKKGWMDEAIDTLKEGVENHKVPDDRVAMDLNYLLMDALEKSAIKKEDAALAKEAREIGSDILQININYKDIKDRVNKLRALVDKFS